MAASIDLATCARLGFWVCENAKALNRAVSGPSAFDLGIELKNVILVVSRFCEFLHSQSQNRI
jgi:hypothetical protein